MESEFGRLYKALEAFPGDGGQNEAIQRALKSRRHSPHISLMDDATAPPDSVQWHAVYNVWVGKSDGESKFFYQIENEDWINEDRIMGVKILNDKSNDVTDEFNRDAPDMR